MNRVIEIPKELASQGDLVIITREEYDSFLVQLNLKEPDESAWRKAAKKNLMLLYDKADSVYDQL